MQGCEQQRAGPPAGRLCGSQRTSEETHLTSRWITGTQVSGVCVCVTQRETAPTSPLLLPAFSPDAVWMLSFAHRTTGVILTLGILTTSAAVLIKHPPPPPPARLTGISVTALEYLYYVSQGKGFSSVVSSLEPLTQHPWLWTDLKFLLAFPLTFHFFNGIRHLVCVVEEPPNNGHVESCPLLRSLQVFLRIMFRTHTHLQYWDTGRGFGLKFVYGAGYTVLVVSLCTAIGLALYTNK